jgi:hypothetical protein
MVRTSYEVDNLIVVCGHRRSPWIGETGHILLVMRCFLRVRLLRGNEILVRKSNVMIISDSASDSDEMIIVDSGTDTDDSIPAVDVDTNVVSESKSESLDE